MGVVPSVPESTSESVQKNNNSLLAEIEARKLAESLLLSTLNSTADGILVVNHAGKIISYNRRFKELWRIPDEILASYNDDQAIAFVLSQLKSPEDFLKKVQELYSRPNDESMDLLEFKDGRVFERYSRPQELEGRSIGRVWSFRDVTKYKEVENKLRQHMLELEQFAYVASHDLKEPLRTISAYVQLLARKCEQNLDAESLQYVNRIVDGASRMHSLVEDLLTYARLGSGAEGLSPVNADNVLKEVIRMLGSVIQKRGVTIHAKKLPSIIANETQLGQVFQNLIDNAIKFNKSSHPEIRIGVERAKDKYIFSFCDNGIGIEPKFTKRIFGIFQRLHTSNEYSGTGIGLALCKKIIERHGGAIWAESEAKKGTTFFFTLPSDEGNMFAPSTTTRH
jgi:signal transduction histidine kinase